MMFDEMEDELIRSTNYLPDCCEFCDQPIKENAVCEHSTCHEEWYEEYKKVLRE